MYMTMGGMGEVTNCMGRVLKSREGSSDRKNRR
jgi:hypothetical protein